MVIKKALTFILCLALIDLHSVNAVELSSLSSEELSAVKKLGLSESELAGFSEESLKEKIIDKLVDEKQQLKNRIEDELEEKIQPKIDKIKNAIEDEKKELKKDAKKLAAGYMTSTMSLFAATLIAPQAIMVCKTKPSAVIYAGTAALYVLQEMRNIKVLKASQLAEIEVVSEFKTDRNKSLKENAAMLEEKVDLQVGYIKKYKNTIDHAVTALKNKAKNAKMVSVGFLAASATAAAEQMDWISGGGACVVAAQSSPEKMNFSKELDNLYAAMIDSSNKVEDKWALYYEWESLKFGVDRVTTKNEYEKFKQLPVSNDVLKMAMTLIHESLLSTAFAQNDSKKVTVAGSLKNDKAADWYGDLDKLGIVGGVAVNVVAYMAGWQMGFLKSIIASGTSRSITFGVQGALAFSAGKLFEDAAKSLEEKLTKVDKLINGIQAITKKGIQFLVISDQDSKNIQKIAEKLGVASDKLITEMTLNEASDYLSKIKEKIHTLDDQAKAIIANFEEQLNQQLKDKKEELEEKFDEKKAEAEKKLDQKKKEVLEKMDQLEKDFKKKVKEDEEKLKKKVEEKSEKETSDSNVTLINHFISFFIAPVSAQAMNSNQIVTKYRDIDCVEKRTCAHVPFPRSNHPQTKILGQYLSLMDSYALGVKNQNQKLETQSYLQLSQNKSVLSDYRDNVFKLSQKKSKSNNLNYKDFENAKIEDEIKKFSNFYNNLSPADQRELSATLNPKDEGHQKVFGRSRRPLLGGRDMNPPKLSMSEIQLLERFVKRMVASKKASQKSPDMAFVEAESEYDEQEFNYGNISIHPKEAELFEIIHLRHLNFYQKYYSEL